MGSISWNPIPERIPMWQVRVAPGTVLGTFQNKEDAEAHAALVPGAIVGQVFRYPDGAIRWY